MRVLQRKWWVISAGTVVLLLALAIVVAQMAVEMTFGDQYDRFGSIQVGMTDPQTTEPGYSYKRRDISNAGDGRRQFVPMHRASSRGGPGTLR